MSATLSASGRKSPGACARRNSARKGAGSFTETGQGRGILGVIDGVKTKGIETDADIKWREEFLRKIGYKL